MFSLLNDSVTFCFQALLLTSNTTGIFFVQYAARLQSSPIWSDSSLKLCSGLFLSGIGGNPDKDSSSHWAANSSVVLLSYRSPNMIDSSYCPWELGASFHRLLLGRE